MNTWLSTNLPNFLAIFQLFWGEKEICLLSGRFVAQFFLGHGRRRRKVKTGARRLPPPPPPPSATRKRRPHQRRKSTAQPQTIEFFFSFRNFICLKIRGSHWWTFNLSKWRINKNDFSVFKKLKKNLRYFLVNFSYIFQF